MRIQHNISAMNAGRNLRKNTSSLKKNLEKLSSGFRINRSADDAAGLAISESMRASIACLEQAENNSADGISLVQTADGAMQEIHDMLDRMAGLAAQAANGTLTAKEREHIQKEIDQILDEITRIKNETEFNGIPLLQGDEATTTNPPVILGGMPSWVGMPGDNHLADEYVTKYTYTITTTTTNPDGTTSTSSTNGVAEVPHEAAFIDFSNLVADPADPNYNLDELLDEDVGFYSTCCTCDNHYSVKFTMDSSEAGVKSSGDHYIYTIDISSVQSSEDLVNAIIAGTNQGIPNGHYTEFAGQLKDPFQAYDPVNNPITTLVVFDGRSNIGENALYAYNNNNITIPADSTLTWGNDWRSYTRGQTATASSSRGKFGEGVAYDASTVSIGDMELQIGENETSRMKIDLPNMALSRIGVNGLSVATDASARAAISRIKSGVRYVSGERGRMGAYQNRLEHTHKNLGNTVENLAQSESVIRDVDVAEEMMAYTKNNILIQSAQAMLAQSNQVPQGVLQLMQ